ncbi:MAG: S8 family peptidase [Bacteroidota bacterium]|jgi:cell wall-associated protease|nr:MAG: peptidase S8 [Bacteroidota bacterium]
MKKIRAFLISLLIISALVADAQSVRTYITHTDSIDLRKEWFLLDPELDRVQGVSVERAYKLLEGKPSRTVIVAVMDSGVDIDHEDLKDVIWVNEDEIPGNGVDDDENGYVDDVHGWNFIGNVHADTYELTREYARLRAKYDTDEPRKIRRKEKAEYEYWLMVKDRFQRYKAKSENDYKTCQQQLDSYKAFHKNLKRSIDLIQETYGLEEITPAIVDTIKSTNKDVELAAYFIKVIYQNTTPGISLDEVLDEFEYVIEHNGEVCDHYRTAVEVGYNPDFDPRTLVGDNYEDLEERHYGNNDVKGPDPSHGTSVAGVIAAKRNNGLGIDGIADNVRIMPIRVVPNGDERDKDIANGIYYAVDNGAHIINMSFGKSYSPHKEIVDKAVRYAESKGVLIIHSAGNDKDDNDVDESFPTRFYKNGKEASNWLEVGASTQGTDSSDLIASFSNYGKKTVDFFAPGVDIYSTDPGNEYDSADGTSLSSPVTSGVAAILMSYFPNLTAQDIRNILRESTRRLNGVKVRKPDTLEEVRIDQICIAGGIVNAYEAVRLAMRVSGEKRPE